ncbi:MULTISPECIES: 1-acyl-sn-glycerol-3-phosphate acyltransferase [unclassified Curtobacterium]|uniref:lysophospholipid acyltransferase family protein n=1 Tax=unclassified Curtobacterium TaxID=257496 RepID=UPI0021ABCF77|nr:MULTISPECIES: lysophospholipid acyltransferase family protein [unclassified Curtobacterium]WIB66312.1 lysophospholipid acyltransferase family protein [Curtobacterium sp. MCBD17_035]
MPDNGTGSTSGQQGGGREVVTAGLPTPGRRFHRGDLNGAFRVVASIVIPMIRVAARFRWHGSTRLPAEGPFIVAPNHYTNIDPLVVGTVVWLHRRLPQYLAKASLFRVPVLGYFMRGMGNVPVERSGRTRGSDPLTGGRALVAGGGGLIVYPEGTLTRDPDLWPMRGKTGAVRLALENDVPLIPMAHWGTQRIMPRYGRTLRLFPPSRVDVAIGEPLDLSAYRGRPLDQHLLQQATAELMQAITALVEELRGERAPAERWDPAANNQKETGRFA